MKVWARGLRIAEHIPWCIFTHRTVSRFLCLLTLETIQLVQADNMYFQGELIKAPNCTVNEGRVIDVAFGQNLAVRKLDGVNYRQTVNYEIRCDANTFEWSLSLKVEGRATSFNPAALQTSVDGLGIEIRQNGEPLIIGKALMIDPQKPPTLHAVPVKRPDTELIATVFNVMATLTAEYQ